jgi:hypothetical protein
MYNSQGQGPGQNPCVPPSAAAPGLSDPSIQGERMYNSQGQGTGQDPFVPPSAAGPGLSDPSIQCAKVRGRVQDRTLGLSPATNRDPNSYPEGIETERSNTVQERSYPVQERSYPAQEMLYLGSGIVVSGQEISYPDQEGRTRIKTNNTDLQLDDATKFTSKKLAPSVVLYLDYEREYLESQN